MGITEFRIDTRNGKFLMTPIMRDKSEWPFIDATEMHDKFMRERGHRNQAPKPVDYGSM
jgi:hypothetical protein